MTARFQLCPSEHLGAPQTKKSLNLALFSVVAPKYDFITKALSFGRDAAWKRALLAELPPAENPACADLACGTGDLARLLANRYPAGDIAGLDLTPAMLEIARRQNGHAHARYLEGSMDALPFGDASLDIVTGGYALRNAPDLEQTLDELARVLRPGGTAAFLDFSKPRNRLGQQATHLILKFWGGLWGLLLHGNPDVYGYIADSLRRYPDRTALRALFETKGLRLVKSRLCFLGLLEITVFERRPGRVA